MAGTPDIYTCWEERIPEMAVDDPSPSLSSCSIKIDRRSATDDDEDDEKGKDYDRRAGSRHCLVIMSRGRGPKGGMREEEDTGRAGDCGRLADREHDLSNATDRKQMVPATSFWASSPLLN